MLVNGMIVFSPHGLADAATHLDHVARRLLPLMYIIVSVLLLFIGWESPKGLAANPPTQRKRFAHRRGTANTTTRGGERGHAHGRERLRERFYT